LSDLLFLYFKNGYIGTFQHILEAKSQKSKYIDNLINTKIANQFIEIKNKAEEYQKKLKKEERRKKEEEDKRKKKKK
jgi:hypothetical protein